MRRFMTLLGLLLLITTVSFYLYYLSGYVLIIFPQWNVQTPLWFAFLLTLSIFIVAYLLLLTVRTLLGLNQRIAHWFKLKKIKRGQQALYQGVFALLAEQFTQAQTKLHEASRLPTEQLFTQLALIFLAHQQGEYQQRDEYCIQLQRENPAGQIEFAIFQARLQIESGDFTKAIDLLNTLRHAEAKYAAILRLLAKVHYHQHQLAALTELLPSLKKHQSVDQDTYATYLGATSQAKLTDAADKESLLSAWRNTADLARQQYPVLATYVQQLLKYNAIKEAEVAVRSQILQQPSGELYLLYASISADEQLQILQIEAFLRVEPSDATLLFAAGKLCMRFRLWGKARDYFSASLQQKADARVYTALAELFEQLGDKGKATLCYKQGLALLIPITNEKA